MNVYKGRSVCNGIAIGKISLLKKERNYAPQYHIQSPCEEVLRLKSAIIMAKSQLEKLRTKAFSEVGEENAAIFEVHKMMLDDNEFVKSIEEIIYEQKLNAEYSIKVVSERFSSLFSAMDDPYMRGRAIDVKDISDRLISILLQKEYAYDIPEEPVILAAEDFTPSETLQLDKSKILAFVTAKGSSNSHTAILARTMNIPAIIGVDIFSIDDINGKIAVVDGFNGILYIDPDTQILEDSYKVLNEERRKKEHLEEYKGKENTTIDGRSINIFANIGNIKDLSLVLENDAGGIGLFRSEFIFLEKNTFPSEEEQFAIYKNAVETMNGKKVIIRTLDIGADKKVDYFDLKEEQNPALGLRAIRLCLKRPEIFKVQLRALLRAAYYGNLSVMFPMIISVEEVIKAKGELLLVAAELKEEQIPHKIPEIGIMIETPAAVMISDELAEEVDFFSIGTNDLSQYAMAIDRQNEDLDEFCNPYHPAIVKMIEIVTKNAHKAGIWVGICGELAGDVSMTETFLSIGVDELSVSPSSVLILRKKVREINLSHKKSDN